MKTLKATSTQKAIIKMLKEDTGRHVLDSGGAYGRNFERNKDIDFLTSPKFFDNTDQYGINFSYNIFWYLTQFLDITSESKALNSKFQRYYKKHVETSYAPEIMEGFVGNLMETSETEPLSSTVNTYNYDNVLSQTIQYVPFKDENDNVFIILQIHGGCDVRGGYTDPKIFQITGYHTQQSEAYENFLTAQTDCSASDGDNSWDSYNSGYTFEASGNNDEPDFKDIAIIIGNKVYNKQNGKRITFGNMEHWDGGEGEIMPEITELRTFVQNNYTNENLVGLAKQEFNHFEFDIEPFINGYIAEIESKTLSLEL